MDNYTSSERVWLERLNGYPPEYAVIIGKLTKLFTLL